jgi:hypothetical protein
MEQTECSETLAYKIQTPENYPEESIQHSEHGESLESSTNKFSSNFRIERDGKVRCQVGKQISSKAHLLVTSF